MPVQVVLDTNMQGEVERLLEEPHQFVVLEQCLDELKEMAEKNRKFSPASRAALLMIEKSNFRVERNFKGKPDNAMVEFCVANNGILVTIDAALRKKAKSRGVKTIFLRGESRLALA